MDNMKKHIADAMISATQTNILHAIREHTYEAEIVHVEDLWVLIKVKDQPIAGVQDPGPRYFRIKISEQH